MSRFTSPGATRYAIQVRRAWWGATMIGRFAGHACEHVAGEELRRVGLSDEPFEHLAPAREVADGR